MPSAAVAMVLSGQAVKARGLRPCSARPALALACRRPRLACAAVAAPPEPRQEQTPTAAPGRGEEADAGPGPSGRVVLESPDELKSTMEHRLWVGGTTALMALTAVGGLAQVHDAGGAVGATVAAFAGYVLSDLGTGIYHWAVDNYGSGATPVFGSQIAAFQGHHQRPWTITEREFCNNVHLVFKPALPIAGVLAALAPMAPAWWDVWAATMLFMACMSQQFHAWSHMKRSELHPAVVALQDAGLLIGRKEHGAHHKAPFDGYYCIVSGWWNDWLDQGGADTSPLRRAERFIAGTWGVEPRCWYQPSDGWQELTRSP